MQALDLMDYLDLIQWPAMAITLLASWMVGATCKGERNSGFWIFLVSNVLWIIWGVKSAAWALVVLQVGLMVMNIRGTMKTDKPSDESPSEKP